MQYTTQPTLVASESMYGDWYIFCIPNQKNRHTLVKSLLHGGLSRDLKSPRIEVSCCRSIDVFKLCYDNPHHHVQSGHAITVIQ